VKHGARFPWLLVLFLMLPLQGLAATLSCPFPVAEAEHVLSRWFTDSGFVLSRSARDAGVALEARRGGESWTVAVKPHSPLACRLDVQYSRDGRSEEKGVRQLSAYLDAYRKGAVLTKVTGNYGGVPAAVFRHVGAIVCIEAQGNGKRVQFSGFVTEPGDRVLSTAHDLEGVEFVSVNLDGVKRFPGRVVRADFHRDLSLITLGSAHVPAVDPGRGRMRPDRGERVYAVGCPLGDHGRIVSGLVEEPSVQSDGLPFWLIDMEVSGGSSGSPVFDGEGRLVGVVKGRYRGTDSTGFVMPLHTISEFLGEGSGMNP
jgi:serine protease Do